MTSAGSTSYLPGMGEAGATCSSDSTVTAANVNDCNTGRPFGGNNVGFADGHAKWLKSAVLVALAHLTGSGFWNPANNCKF